MNKRNPPLARARAVLRLVLAGAFVASACLARFADAGEPAVRLVIPVPAGGGLDVTGRKLAARLAELTGVPYVIENRPGANTAIGAELVARAPADGNTILYSGSSIVMNPWLQKLAPSPFSELRPVAQLSDAQYVVLVAARSKIASVHDVRAPAPPAAPLACAAPPGPMGLACEQLKARLGGNLIVVPYPGISPAAAALLGGHVDLLFVNVEAVEALMQNGTARAIAASSPAAAAGVPLIGQVWPGLLLDGFTGLFVPAQTPPEKVRELNALVNRVLGEPEFAAFMQGTRQERVGGPPERFATRIADSYRRYGDAIRKLGLGLAAPDHPLHTSQP